MTDIGRTCSDNRCWKMCLKACVNIIGQSLSLPPAQRPAPCGRDSLEVHNKQHGSCQFQVIWERSEQTIVDLGENRHPKEIRKAKWWSLELPPTPPATSASGQRVNKLLPHGEKNHLLASKGQVWHVLSLDSAQGTGCDNHCLFPASCWLE